MLKHFLQFSIHIASIYSILRQQKKDSAPTFYLACGKQHSLELRHLSEKLGGVSKRPLTRLRLPPKETWLYDFLYKTLCSLWNTSNKASLFFVQWGYSASCFLGFRPEEKGFKSVYLENDLIGFGSAQGRGIVGYVCDGKAPYFDGRKPTDLESLLNVYASGAWKLNKDESEFIYLIKQTALHKYSNYSGDTDLVLTEDDVLIFGQVANDAAWRQSDCAVLDNVDLVRAAVSLFPDASNIYYKAHPRWSGIETDRAQIKELYPNVIHLDERLNFKKLVQMRPRVVVNTSGTGLDAGVSGCEVHCFGVSFYSGWGATIDHHPMPHARRQNNLTFEDILIVTSLHYTKHFHRDTLKDATTDDILNELRMGSVSR